MARPHRLDPADYTGYRQYFLTIATYRRVHRFTDSSVVELAVSQFLRVATDERVELLAYCLMPDHVHLLVSARSAATDLQRFVRLAKQRSGYLFLRLRGQRLWQESYYERVLRRTDDLAAVIAYIVANAVRAGLVDEPVRYPYWGSQTYTREEILAFIGSAPRGWRPPPSRV
jgi:putative transposase